MLSDKKYITWKLIYFCINSCKELFNIEDDSRVIGSFLINPQLKCFDFSQTFHGLLLSLQKKIEMKIFMNQSQESLEKSSWISIAMLWLAIIWIWSFLREIGWKFVSKSDWTFRTSHYYESGLKVSISLKCLSSNLSIKSLPLSNTVFLSLFFSNQHENFSRLPKLGLQLARTP